MPAGCPAAHARLRHPLWPAAPSCKIAGAVSSGICGTYPSESVSNEGGPMARIIVTTEERKRSDAHVLLERQFPPGPSQRRAGPADGAPQLGVGRSRTPKRWLASQVISRDDHRRRATA